VILVVEDDPHLRIFYRQVLKISGYTVVAVEDGIDALRHIETDAPDLVILDIELPRLSGRDVQQELAAHAATRNIPIVVVTGSETSALDPRAVFCILRKPVTEDRLVAVIENCMKDAQQRWPLGRDRRTSTHCPFCNDTSVSRHTTVNAGASSYAWSCAACDSAWPERRKAS
jgi:DNA-binding response OmpR family regulator